MNFGAMTETDLREIDVRVLLPQREPFVMIDHITHFDRVVTTTDFEVRENNLFMENGVLNPCALIENIAQTCAARMGYINQYIDKDKIRLGFIGSIKNLTVLRPVLLGEKLTTRIEVVEEVLQMTLVNAFIKVGQETVVTAEMKIALTNIDAE